MSAIASISERSSSKQLTHDGLLTLRRFLTANI